MKVNYRGFEIDAYREKCMAGYVLLYYSVMRIKDGWEFDSGFLDTRDTVRTIIKCFKRRVDDYHKNPESRDEVPYLPE